jgi:hypothetical protein
MTTLTQTFPPAGFILSEANGQRSRENFLVSLGKKLKAGQVAKVEPAVSLATTAHIHTNTVMDVLAAVTNLVVGDVYAVTGTGIPAGTTFTYGGSSAGTLSQAATGTSTGVTFTFTKPAGTGPWLQLSDTAAGVSINDVDATTAAVMGSFIARDAEVNLKLLVFPADTDADVISDLAGIDIICRD